MPTIMVAVGIVGLAGIVVKNAILLIEFTDELRGRGMRTREATIQAGRDPYHPGYAYSIGNDVRFVAIGGWFQY